MGTRQNDDVLALNSRGEFLAPHPASLTRFAGNLQELNPFRHSRTGFARDGPLNHSGQESHLLPPFLCELCDL